MSWESCDSEDEYSHDQYAIWLYTVSKGPPLIKKKSRLIAAVVQNQVEILEDLLDSPKWYNVCDKEGYSLLQIAVIEQNKEVFDYMLSIPDFPLEFVNRHGQTALVLAHVLSHEYNMIEYIPHQLMKKGAGINKICNYNPLCFHRPFEKICKLLTESSVDDIVRNYGGKTPLDRTTPLDRAFNSFINPSLDEVFRLLCDGVIPTMDLFEKSVLRKMDHGIQENLFLFLCDEYTTLLKLDIMVVLKLIEAKSVLTDEIIKYPIKIKIKIKDGNFFDTLCSMSIDGLKLTLEKFYDCVRQAFSLIEFESHTSCTFFSLEFISLDNLDLMLRSNLRQHVIHYILRWERLTAIHYWEYMYPNNYILVEFWCYLLSHDLITLRSEDLDWFFLNRPREFFKFLLYMDVKLQPRTYHYLNNPKYHSEDNVQELVKYFAHPKLKKIYLLKYSGDEKKDLPELPTLVELARNSFRNYFIKRFNITTCKQFYYLMDCLLISSVYKKIITYETELY